MGSPASPRIKICCMQSAEEIALAVRFGADAVGFVSAMPSGLGPISEELIAALIPTVPARVASFLLTSRRSAAAIADQVRRLGPTTVQIVDRPEAGCRAALRRLVPATRIVQVVHVTGPEALAEAVAASPQADAVLLDSGNPALAVKELGGTGRTHDWATSRKIREAVGAPLWLAGGLTPENVASAIEVVRPFGVDVCSGVRTNGRLDEQKLARFVEAARGARRE
jgi:phosphoribosylanthranilate isomerase